MELYEGTTEGGGSKATTGWDGDSSEPDNRRAVVELGRGDLPLAATPELSEVDSSHPPETVSAPTELPLGVTGSTFRSFSVETSENWTKLQTFDLGFTASARSGVCTPRAPTAASPACDSPGATRPTQLLSPCKLGGRHSRFREPVTSVGSPTCKAGRPSISVAIDGSDEDLGRPLVSKDDVIGYMNDRELGNFLLQHNLTVTRMGWFTRNTSMLAGYGLDLTTL